VLEFDGKGSWKVFEYHVLKIIVTTVQI